MALFHRQARPEPIESVEARQHRSMLSENFTFEVLPFASFEREEGYLPTGASVSVTISPKKGFGPTMELTERLINRGFAAIPHLSARMVTGQHHAEELADWCRKAGVNRAFVVGGDADKPGAFADAEAFLRAFLPLDHGLEAVGIPAYPDGHGFISDDALHHSLHVKQQLIVDAGLDGWCSTQLCFDPTVVARWIQAERNAGLTLPIHLGVAGVVDRTKLVTTGMRIGVGQSLSYLKKNRAAVSSMLSHGAYNPDELLIPLTETNLELGVDRLHVFTFNQVENTERWRQQVCA